MTEIKTLEQIESEMEYKLASLTGMESQLLALHDHEANLRTEIKALEHQRERLRGIRVEA